MRRAARRHPEHRLRPHQRDGRLAGAGDELAARRPVDAVHQRRERPDVQGDDGPLLGLLVWPADRQREGLPDARRHAAPPHDLAAAAEVDNPYFNVNRNGINSKNNRLITNLGLTLTPFSWGSLKTNIGADSYTNQNSGAAQPGERLGQLVQRRARRGGRHHAQPQRADACSTSIAGRCHGESVAQRARRQPDHRRPVDTMDALNGQDFLDPNFVSINNTNLRSNRTTLAQRRLVGAVRPGRRSTTRSTCTSRSRAGTTGRRRFRRAPTRSSTRRSRRASSSPTRSRHRRVHDRQAARLRTPRSARTRGPTPTCRRSSTRRRRTAATATGSPART